jgi:glutathione-regulated potassium-efflux system protein KefB
MADPADAAHAALSLTPVVTLLAAAVVAVPIFRRLGLGSVLGYFAAGVVVGPWGLGLFTHPEDILHVSELGVVMFLFLVGLEMKPQRLWALRRAIFGLGLAQVVTCIAALTLAAAAFGFPWLAAFVAGAGFVLSSTAVVMQVLAERGETATPEGQRAVSILLLEDLAIVPLLAVVALLSPAATESGGIMGAVVALAALAGFLAAGRWALDPMLAILARAKTREVMTAGALLIALGSAYVMDAAGLSMAMGAFLAGVLLSGSSYRHQIEADVEPFKGILLGLFFLAVGMSLDLGTVWAQAGLVAALLVTFMAVKAAGIFAVARISGSPTRAALRRMSLFTQGGEFAFVLYAAALAGGIFTAADSALFGAVIILSMALTPLVLIAVDRLIPPEGKDENGVERPEGLHGAALVIGFGRVGQIASQLLLARGVEVSLIEKDPDRIRDAARFGFKVYYGDGTRLDILHASGAHHAAVIVVAVDDGKTALHIVDLLREEFPQARLVVRARDRRISIELIRRGVTAEVRETLKGAVDLGAEALRALGVDAAEVDEIAADILRRDVERLALQVAGDTASGVNLMHNNTGQPVVAPEPLTAVRRAG